MFKLHCLVIISLIYGVLSKYPKMKEIDWVIMGYPNTGKSCLFNTFCKRKTADLVEPNITPYSFTTAEPESFTIELGDRRFDSLCKL